MRLLVDAQLPPGLAPHLVTLKNDAIHVEDVGLRHASDTEILQYAMSEKRILVTKDRDFAMSLQGGAIFQMVWVRTGNISNSALFERFSASWAATRDLLAQGHGVVELR